MLDVAKLHILTDATLPALAKLNFAAKVELGLQKKVGSAGGASEDLQAVLKGARQPLAQILEFISENDDTTSLTPTKVEPALAEVSKPKLSRRSLKLHRRGYKLFSCFPPSQIPEGYQPAIMGSTVELGEWDKTAALQLNRLKAKPRYFSTSWLPAPTSNERVDFRWVFVGKDDAEIVNEI